MNDRNSDSAEAPLLKARTHHAAGVGLAHGVGVAERKAGVWSGGGLAEGLAEQAGGLRRLLLRLLLLLLVEEATGRRAERSRTCRERTIQHWALAQRRARTPGCYSLKCHTQL